MPKQDFLMRMIEQLRGLLPYVLDLARSGNYAEAHAVIDQAVRQLVGIGTDGLVKLPDEAIIDRLQADNVTAWDDKCQFLTALLVAEADILMQEGEEEAAYGRYLKSLHLLLWLAQIEGEPLPANDLIPDIDQVVEALADFHLPGESCVRLLGYYEQMGDYTAVENLLFDWLENTPPELVGEANPAQTGLEIFQRLLLLPDPALEGGGLTREEVQIAIEDLLDLGE
ncbi:MAG TPA: DUF6483 family protein [Chloroflexota bacterium]|nr:DUF6483 family protein [Chloroflexota bacterium]HUM71720.1 DUF6483 family protein [Chloroflexota bacterium]